MNPFDEIAVEEALRLREKHGGEVVVASIGGEKSVTEIRAALAMGADRGVLVRHDGPLDPVVVSALLAKVFEQEKPDLVLLGKQSIDDDQNQAGQYLAERLGLAAGHLRLEDGEPRERGGAEEGARAAALRRTASRSQVVREVDGGVETLEVTLPAVVTRDLRLNKPRFASLPGIMKAKKKEVKELQAAALGVDLAPKVVVRRLSEPPARKGGVKVADVEELWRKLHDEAKVL